MNNHKMDPHRFSDAVLEFWYANRQKTTCTITGNSMAPVICNGDRLTIRYGAGDIRIGDIVVFKSDSKLIAHRVIRKHSDAGAARFLLKGDASRVFDPPVSIDRILGKVTQVNGQRGRLYLESGLWKSVSYVIAFVSYLSGKCRAHDSLRWKTVRAVAVLISGMLPKRFSYMQVLFNCTYILEKSLPTFH